MDRTFARLDDLSTYMNQGHQVVVFFTGPSGTGKTTTLKVLYSTMKRKNKDSNKNFFYIDANLDELDFPAKSAYVFVDNAQCLLKKQELVGNLRAAKALCFAFSSVVVTKDGETSVKQCGFRFTKKYNFRPFTEDEVEEFSKKQNINEEVIKEAKKIGVLLPSMIQQCSTPSEVGQWIHDEICAYLTKVEGRLRGDNDNLRTTLMSAAMGLQLKEAEQAYASRTGLFYVDDSDAFILVFPAEYLLNHLHPHIICCYHLFKEYDTGATFEFLTCAQLKSRKNEIFCIGKEPTPVTDSLNSKSPANGIPSFSIPAANKYIVQSGLGDDLKSNQSCCLVKLQEEHFGIDFIIVIDTAGSASKRLFVVQASVTKYQQRTGPKLSEIYDVKDGFDEKSLVNFYCDKLSIANTHCFFVFACPEVPTNERFTKDVNSKNKVYFLKVKCC